MATNPAAKIPDIMRLAVAPGAETPVVFPGTVTLIDWMVQAEEASGTYVSYEAGGTFSPDNYWTLKANGIWYQQDMNWTPPENAMYLRAQGANPITVEIMYWS